MSNRYLLYKEGECSPTRCVNVHTANGRKEEKKNGPRRAVHVMAGAVGAGEVRGGALPHKIWACTNCKWERKRSLLLEGSF